MALPATMVWEVRSDTGIDTNGGAYNPAVTSPGTDYTYPTSAPISYTDLSAPTVTTLTSTARPFIAADNGNTVKTTSNGYFAITSVSGGTATGVWSGTAPTAGTTGLSGTLGGALATVATALPLRATGNDTYLRYSPSIYPLASAPACASGRIIGYYQSRDDIPLGGDNRPTIQLQSGFPSAGFAASQTLLKNIIIDGHSLAVSWCSIAFGNTLWGVYNCKVMNFAATFLSGSFITALFTEATGFTGSSALFLEGGNHQSNSSIVYGCWIHNNTNGGVSMGAASLTSHCLFSNSGGVYHGGLSYCLFNTLYKSGQVPSTGLSLGNILHTSSDYGIGEQFNVKPSFFETINGNAYYNITPAIRYSGYGASGGDTLDTILTADPFVNASGGDFRLNNNAGGGALLRGKGLPLSFPGLPSVANARDMGAYQHATPALGLTVNTSGANPVLTWDADPRVSTGYVILRGATASALAEIATVGSGTTTYTDASVSSGTYVYSVASY